MDTTYKSAKSPGVRSNEVRLYTYVGLYICKYLSIYGYGDILNINKYIKYVFIILILLESNKQNIEYQVCHFHLGVYVCRHIRL